LFHPEGARIERPLPVSWNFSFGGHMISLEEMMNRGINGKYSYRKHSKILTSNPPMRVTVL
jgi:hypothetical protein